jgi:hypothetical protein
MRAWANGLRRIAQWSMPGRLRLSMNSVRPVRSAGSSTRSTARPTKRGELVGRSSSRFGISIAISPLVSRGSGSYRSPAARLLPAS